LRRLIQNEDVKNAIIFCNRKRDVDILNRSLIKHGFDAAALHGDMPQSKRTETLDRFRNGEIRLLVASDVAARGLDIQGMSHVFNFDVPIHAEDYIHRIGRTGRAGRGGRAFTLASASEDGRFVQAIEQLIGVPIPVVALPGISAAALDAEPEQRRDRRGPHARRTGDRKPRPPREAAAAPKEQASAERPPRDDQRPPRTEQRPPHDERKRRGRSDGQRPSTPRFAPVTMEQIAMDPGANVTPLPRRDDRRPQEAEDDHGIIGFGDHMPAFLARPGRRARG
jgi:superfamily II DNA/RNA helicase